jgi:hypothetical protein
MIRKKLALAKPFVRQHTFKIGAVLVLLILITFFYEGKVVLEPGVRAKNDPVQINVKNLNPVPSPWSAYKYSFNPLASYTIEAKVLGKERYRTGKESDLSPYDLALGWQEMSDQAVVDKISISQRRRWYYYNYSDASIPQQVIQQNSANNHIIPANDEVLDVLHDIRTGDIVVLDGYLVEVRDNDGWSWRSSLTRADKGAHACEVFWVEAAKITTPLK